MNTKLIDIGGPRRDELVSNGGGIDAVFVREDERGRQYKIYAAICYESWMQWGEAQEILADNIDAVETWRRGMDGVLNMMEGGGV